MAKAVWRVGGAQLAITLNPATTYYTYPIQGAPETASTTEASKKTPIRSAGVFSRIAIVISANDTTGAGTLKSRINGADGSQSVSIPAGTTGTFVDENNTDAIIATDQYDLVLTTGSGGTTVAYTSSYVVFTPTSNTITKLGGSTGTNTTSTPVFKSISGNPAPSTTESPVQSALPLGGTLKNAYSFLISNTRNGTVTQTVRINGSSSTISISIPSTTAGLFEDATHTETVAAGDLVCWTESRAGTTGSAFSTVLGISLETTDGKSIALSSNGSSGVAWDGQSLKYFSVLGGVPTLGSTESLAQVIAHEPITLSKFNCRVITNGEGSKTATIQLRKNGANINQAISIGAGLTGVFSDAVNTDNIAYRTDLISASISYASGTGSGLTFTSVGLVSEAYVAPPVSSIVALIPGQKTTLIQNQTYQLPGTCTEITVITSGGTIEVSLDGTTWQAMTLDSNKNFKTSAIFIHSINTTSDVVVKPGRP